MIIYNIVSTSINSNKLISQPYNRRLNTNVDLIVPGLDLLKRLKTATNLKPYDHAIINSIDEFQQTFAHYFAKGSAAERFFSQLNDFNHIIEHCDSLDKKQVSFLCALS